MNSPIWVQIDFNSSTEVEYKRFICHLILLYLSSPWLVTFTSDKSLLGIIMGEVLNNLIIVDLNPMVSTIPCNLPSTSIRSPG